MTDCAKECISFDMSDTKRCLLYSQSGMVCTRVENHRGPHMACGIGDNEHPMEAWMTPKEIQTELATLREQLRTLTKPISDRIQELMKQCQHQYGEWRDIDDEYGSKIRDCVICGDYEMSNPWD